MSRHWRTIAGNLELFLGAYFIGFGLLGLLYFLRLHDRNGRFGSAAGIVIGLLLLLRARKVLAWHRAVFWLVALLCVAVPVGLLLPVLLRMW
ncbi:MAG TPA: hypothetical protein VF975_10120 [Thermoanaerobaculia bacterium]